ARIVGKDGKPLGNEGNGPPTFGSSVVDSKADIWQMSEGRFPKGPTEVALDEASAEAGKFVLGDTVKVITAVGSQEFTLVGIANYGDVRSPGGATFALWDVDTASSLLAKPGYIDAVIVVGDGTMSDEALTQKIQAALPTGKNLETITGAQITKETQDDIKTALSFFGILLTIFAFIGLGVGSFVIYNVFSISAAQRQRENALLRAIGASRRQVTIAMLLESLAVGLVGSVLGLLGGIGLSAGLTALLKAIGVDLPSSGLVVGANTIVQTILIGLIVTVASALLPAFRAGRVPPLAAMRDTALDTAGKPRVRLVLGGTPLLAGVALIGAVIGGARTELLGLAILFIFIGALTLGPLVARPVALTLGRPIASVRGVTGRMARQNAARNPKRTSRTAAPVLIGVALVTAVTALAASIQAEIRGVFGEQFTGDFTISSEAQGFGGLSPSLAVDVSKLDGVKQATGIGQSVVEVEGKGRFLTVINPKTVEGIFDIGLLGDAKVTSLSKNGVLVSEKTAERDKLTNGSTIPAKLSDGTQVDLVVEGVYANDQLAGRYTVSSELFEGTTVSRFDFGVYILKSEGTDSGALRADLQKLVDSYGSGTLLSKDEYIDKQAAQVNQLLGLIYGLLFLSIIIAIVGIIITLLLSVYERQREIGLLRAVGMTRGQVRSAVRWESVITSLIGAVTGILLGFVLGYVVILSLRDQGITKFELPISSAVTILIVAFVVGVLAAAYPARRATKVDVLAALNTM
ncbi:MAG: ABC transporter permease, partial [Actinomycetota bacterium]